MQISSKSYQNKEVHPLQETNGNPVTRIYKIVRCMKSQITKLLHFKTYQNKKVFRIIRSNLTALVGHCMPWTEGSINHLKYISIYTRVGTFIVATIYLQLIQNRYMFRCFTLLQCSHQHCVQPVASDVEVVGYL